MAQKFDAIVIGTGFGGAVTSCRLAQAGLRTLVLERGRRYDLASLPDLPKPGQLLPDPCRWRWSDSQGLWDLRDLHGVLVAQSAAYGGGSLVYANVHLRPPRDVFKEGWPKDCRDRTDIDRFYDLAGYMLEITPVPEAWRSVGKVKVMSEAFRDTARGVLRNGMHPDPAPQRPEDVNVFFPPLAIKFPEHPKSDAPDPPTPPPEGELKRNRHGRHQGECERCGACDFGCRYGAKNTLDRNYLAVAENSGVVTIQTLCEALTVSRCDQGNGYQVTYLDHLIDARHNASAKHVFLCGGSVNTTELLLRSFHQYEQLKSDQGDPALGSGLPPVEHVGVNYFINADSLALVVDANRETAPSAGPVITTALVYDDRAAAGPVTVRESRRPRRSTPGGDRSWFLIEDGGYPIPLEQLTAVFKSPLLLGRNRFDIEPLQSLTRIGAAAVKTAPDRYSSFLDGLRAAFEAGQLPDVLPRDVQTALDALLQRACQLRDEEIGDLTEDVRDAVLADSVPFRWLKALHVDTAWPWAWKLAFKLALQLMPIGRDELLANTLGATHHRYGVDRVRGLPDRVVHALLGEPYPVQPPKTSFPRDPRPAARQASQAVLLAMGRDDAPARLELDCSGDIRATFQDGGFPTLAEEERAMRGIADQLGGTLRTSPLWGLARRPITAHSHGGCALGRVTNDWGEVLGHHNLFINDGSLLPRPVGVNPSSTIAAIAERNVEHFVMELQGSLPPAWQKDNEEALKWRANQDGVSLEPPLKPLSITLHHESVGFAFAEEMRGRMARLDREEASRLPRPGRGRIPLAPFLSAEGHGGAGATPHTAGFQLNAQVRDIGAFLDDDNHRLMLSGELTLPPNLAATTLTKAKVEAGTLALLVASARDQRLMIYHLPFAVEKNRWTLIGQKEIQDDPGFDAWLDASTLYVELCRGDVNLDDFLNPKARLVPPQVMARGILRLGLHDFALNQLRGMRAIGMTDPARTIWTLGSFGVFFFGQMQGTFAPEIEHFLTLFGRSWRTDGPTALRGLP
jgi:choline dehydrogenase-like flavoprotein